MVQIEEVDFYKNGWFKKSIEIRYQYFKSIEGLEFIENFALDSSSSNTGLSFGHPINLLFNGNIEELYIQERLKLVYIDYLYVIYCKQNIDIFKEEKKESFNERFAEQVFSFLKNIAKPITIMLAVNNFNKVEKLLNQHLKIEAEWYEGFWVGFKFNTLLYIDLLSWETGSSDFSIIKHQRLAHIQIFEKVYEELKNINNRGNNLLEESFGLSNLTVSLQRHLIRFGFLIIIATKNEKFNIEEERQRLVKYFNKRESEIDEILILSIGFLMKNIKRMRYISTRVNYLELIDYQTELLKITAHKNFDYLKQGIESHKLIKEVLNGREYLSLNWNEKSTIQKEIIGLIFKKITTEEITENAFTSAIVNITKIVPEEILFKGIENKLTEKKPKRITYG